MLGLHLYEAWMVAIPGVGSVSTAVYIIATPTADDHGDTPPYALVGMSKFELLSDIARPDTIEDDP